MTEIKNQLDAMGYDYAVAIATKAEIENGAACGQLAIICEQVINKVSQCSKHGTMLSRFRLVGICCSRKISITA